MSVLFQINMFKLYTNELYRGHYDLIYKNGEVPQTTDDASAVPPITVGMAQICDNDNSKLYRNIFYGESDLWRDTVTTRTEIPETLSAISWNDTLPRRHRKQSTAKSESRAGGAAAASSKAVSKRKSPRQLRGRGARDVAECLAKASHFKNENFQPRVLHSVKVTRTLNYLQR